jgi:hypothetical protein
LALLVCLLLGAAPIAAQAAREKGAAAASAGFTAVAPGVEYRNEVRPDGPLSIHVLRISRETGGWELETGLGQGTIVGLEPLDGIAARTSALLRKPALAAINGDFFVIQPGPYQGDPRGTQITRGEIVSRPEGNSFWVAADGEWKIGSVTSRLRVVWPGGKAETAIGLNEARPADGAVLFTPAFGLGPDGPPGATTRTQGGRELVLEPVAGSPWLPLRVGLACPARVGEVRQIGGTPLSAGRMVLSIGPKAVGGVPAVRAGDLLRLAIETQPDLSGVTTAIGGGRILVRDGKAPDAGPAGQPRHPRSMIGWDRRHVVFFVIDGRQPRLSIGMTYPEMAALAGQYGCTDAIELDGGGSSTLWVRGKIVNSPSDGRPRPVANGLVLVKGPQGGKLP